LKISLQAGYFYLTDKINRHTRGLVEDTVKSVQKIKGICYREINHRRDRLWIVLSLQPNASRCDAWEGNW